MWGQKIKFYQDVSFNGNIQIAPNSGINLNCTNISGGIINFPSIFPTSLSDNSAGIGFFCDNYGTVETDIICYSQGGGGGLSICGAYTYQYNTTPVSRIADLWSNQIKFYQDVSFNENVELSPNSQLTFNNNGISNASIVIPSSTGGATSQSLATTQSLVFSAGSSNNLQLYYDGSNPSWGFQVPNTSNSGDPSNGGEPSNFVLNFPGKTITLTASTIDLTATSGINMSSINLPISAQFQFLSSLPTNSISMPLGFGIGYNLNGNNEIDLYSSAGSSSGGGLLNIYVTNNADGPLQVLQLSRSDSATPTISTNGSISAVTTISASTFSTTSDYRIKENVTELNETYSVDNLRPVEYENKITNKQSLGFIAHEVQEQYSFLVTGEKDGKENQSINYQEIIPILVKEIQDLKKRVTLLEN